jgi:hypothetical protein
MALLVLVVVYCEAYMALVIERERERLTIPPSTEKQQDALC